MPGPRAGGTAVRTGLRAVVVAERRTVATAASARAALAPDLDGDGQPEVVATLGRELEHRVVVSPSGARGRRVELKRPRWDVAEVVGRAGARWLVVAHDPGGRPWLLGFLPRERRWSWSLRLPGHENELDDVDVQGARARVSVFVPGESRSTVLDITAHGDRATVTHTDLRGVGVRASSARIDPAWGVEEVFEPRRESGEQGGRVELVLPDGTRRVLGDVDDDVPAATLLRAGARCALVLVISPDGATTVTAVAAAGGRILVTRRIPRAGLLNVAAVGRRLIVKRREGPGAVVVRALRTDPPIGSCG